LGKPHANGPTCALGRANPDLASVRPGGACGRKSWGDGMAGLTPFPPCLTNAINRLQRVGPFRRASGPEFDEHYQIEPLDARGRNQHSRHSGNLGGQADGYMLSGAYGPIATNLAGRISVCLAAVPPMVNSSSGSTYAGRCFFAMCPRSRSRRPCGSDSDWDIHHGVDERRLSVAAGTRGSS
jgi:hypothetical protein